MALNVNFCLSSASAVKILIPESGAGSTPAALI